MPDLLELVEFFGEPCVKDVVLASRLNMAQPERIRDFIQRNRQELLQYGLLHAKQERDAKSRFPVTAYYLSERQALALCQLIPAGRAPEIRRMLVETFIAWKDGTLSAVQDAGADALLDVVLPEIIGRVDERIDSKLSALLVNDNFLSLPDGFVSIPSFLEEKGVKPLSGPAKGQLSKLARKFSHRNGYDVRYFSGRPYSRTIGFSRECLAMWWEHSGRAIAARKVHEEASKNLPLFNGLI